jgi:formiminotetrahydrofolate cyclodeaminase
MGQTLDGWLTELASEAPAPGGGAAAAINAAVGAALVSMVCRLTIGKPRYAEHEATMTAALREADELRAEALRLADDDAEAFAAVARAYQLPRHDDAATAERGAAIQAALLGAAAVPLATAGLTAAIVGLVERTLDGANVNVISDLAVAAASARAAWDAAAINVEVNLAGLRDPDDRARLAAELDRSRGVPARAEAAIATVRARIAA